MIVQLKNIINEMFLSYSESQDSEAFASLLSEMKQNPKLREVYFAIDNLQNCPYPGDKDKFISENINIIKENYGDLNADLSFEKSELNEVDNAILFLVENKKNASNYMIYEGHLNVLKNNIAKNIDLLSLDDNLSKLMEEHSKLSEEEKLIFEELSVIEDKKTYYDDYKSEVINLVNEELYKLEGEEKLSLYEGRERILAKEYDPKTFVEDILSFNKIKDITSKS
jgi:hypothetical protein